MTAAIKIFRGTNFGYGLAYGFFQVSYIPYFLARGLSHAEIGLLFAVFTLLVAIFSVPTGSYADRYGRHRSFLLGVIFHLLSFVTFAIVQDFVGCLIGQTLLALGQSFTTGTVDAWLTDSLINHQSQHTLSTALYGGALRRQIAMLAGGFLGTWYSDSALILPWICAAVVMGCTGIFAWSGMRNTSGLVANLPQRHGLAMLCWSAIRTYAKSPALRTIGYIHACLIAAYQAPNLQWQPLFQDKYTLAFTDLAWIWILIGSCVALGNYIGTLQKNAGRSVPVVVGSIVMVSVPLLAAPLSVPLMLFAALLGLHEIARGLIGPALSTLLNETIDSAQRSTIISVHVTITTVAGSCGSLLCGIIGSRYGIELSWLCSGILTVLSMGCVVRLLRDVRHPIDIGMPPQFPSLAHAARLRR